MRITLLLLVVASVASVASAQPAPPPKAIVKAGRMFDGKSDKLRTDVAVLIEGDSIKEIGTLAQITAKAPGRN
jgi:hypothetical protein